MVRTDGTQAFRARTAVLAGAFLLALIALAWASASAPVGVAKASASKCKAIKSAAARRQCLSVEAQKAKPPVPVDVRDDFYFPTSLTVKAGRRIAWDWGTTNGNSHDVFLSSGPKSLTATDKYGLSLRRSYAINYRFTRSLAKPGTYDFFCTLHSGVMAMTVRVTK